MLFHYHNLNTPNTKVSGFFVHWHLDRIPLGTSEIEWYHERFSECLYEHLIINVVDWESQIECTYCMTKALYVIQLLAMTKTHVFIFHLFNYQENISVWTYRLKQIHFEWCFSTKTTFPFDFVINKNHTNNEFQIYAKLWKSGISNITELL